MLLRLLRSAFQPRSGATPLVQRALDLRSQGRLADAESTLRDAVNDYPRDAVAATNLAVALLEQDKGEEAVTLLERAIACDAKCAAAHFNYANVLRVSGRLSEAIEHYRAAKNCDPDFTAAPEQLMHTQLEVCAWDGARTIADELRDKVSRGSPSAWMPFISPLTAVYLDLEEDEIKRVAAYHAGLAASSSSNGGMTRVRRRQVGDPIRVGYFSRDFRDHPIGHLLRSVFALHDRTRFHVSAFSYGPDDESVYRSSIAESVDCFVDVARQSDEQAARSIADTGVDVLIDLMGHTTGNRLGVLSRRPAPVQAHYLGYAGTTGASYIDYFVSDEIVTPPYSKTAFTEEVAYVPDCFMVSDGTDAETVSRGTRAEQHLPEGAYVFCNFANSSRITRETFALWMSILKRVPDSVLWLKRSHDLVVANLRRESQACGVDPARLLFAERVRDKPAHLARLALADLALDTIGWHNGHTTTADMLWGGLAVLTVPGKTFASRVAASLVHAAAIDEVIATDPEEYVSVATRLGNNRSESTALQSKLQLMRASAPFFDTTRLVRGLEQAYEGMFAAKMRDSAGL
ncbi:MAG: O-linked N-acetylglucosamine transferase, SPINDLY family protein [Burkholderiales bacterium]